MFILHRPFLLILTALFAREWVKRLRVKDKAPHGEDELPRMTRKWE